MSGKHHVQEGLSTILDALLGGFSPNSCLWPLGYVMLQSAPFSSLSKRDICGVGGRRVLHDITSNQPQR